jgi:hypothetical protein
MLTTHLHLVPRLEVSEAMPLHSQYALIPWTEAKLLFCPPPPPPTNLLIKIEEHLEH